MNKPEIQTFRAETMQQAMEMARKDVGPDAVLLQSRQVMKKGVIGERKAGVEITVSKGMVETNLSQSRSRSLYENSARPGPKILQRTQANLVRDNYQAQAGSEYTDSNSLRQHLSRMEFPESEIHYLSKIVKEHLGPCSDICDPEVIDLLTNVLTERIKTTTLRGQSVVALVGPAGCGKTTTAAKLAARTILIGNQSVALVTIDNFRIAACEQLRIQAEIIGVPFLVANTPARLQASLEQFADKDLVIIDTTSKNSVDGSWIEEMCEFSDPRIHTHLVLGTNMRDSCVKSVLREYANLNYSGLILTKLDETPCKGVIYGIFSMANTPISFIASGQRVPEDLEPAYSLHLAKMALGALPASQPMVA